MYFLVWIFMQRKAIVIGATGLVGRKLIKELASLYDKVTVITRRPPEFISSNMRVYQINDFVNLAETMSGIDMDENTDAFSCLGTTKKQAGSEEEFKRIDHGYNLQFANFCKQKGVKHFFLLSAMGANTSSRFFYNQVKGTIEKDIKQLGFETLYIFRPSLLLGNHQGRPIEKISQSAFRLISPLVSEKINVHPITAKRVAVAMAITAHKHYHRIKRQGIYASDSPVVITNKQMLAMTKTKH